MAAIISMFARSWRYLGLAAMTILSLLHSAGTVDNSGGCVYSFQVWTPNQDILAKIRRIEGKCDNMSTNLDHQIIKIRNRIMEELLQARNLTHHVEKELLELKLDEVQQTILMKDVRIEMMDLRAENRTLWKAVERPSDRGVSHASQRGGRVSHSEFQRVQHEVNVMENLVRQLKNGVGDLKAEWLLIKREVQDIKSENIHLKFGQSDMKADAEKLKNAMDEIKIETTSLKSQTDELDSMHDKLKKSVLEIRGHGSSNRVQNQLDDLASISNHLDSELGKLRERFADMKKEVMVVALAARNVSKDEIASIFEKIPALQQGVLGRAAPKDYIKVPKDCHDVYKNGYDTSDVYQIMPQSRAELDDVYCEMINNTGWTVVQRRVDGSLNFNRGWMEYKHGFGNKYGEFWLGNEILHKISVQKDYVLRVDLWDWEGNRAYAEYDTFRVSSGEEKYKLKARGHQGNAGDSLSYHDEMAFSTEDSDNDLDMRNCAKEKKGGWWFRSCISSNLNGIYHTGWYSKGSQTYADGTVWFTWRQSKFYSVKQVEMKLRPYHL